MLPPRQREPRAHSKQERPPDVDVERAFRFALAQRAGTLLLSALVAHTAWHWMIERGSQLMLYDISLTLPAFDRTLLAASMRWGMLMLIVVALVWLMSMVFPQMEHDGEAERPA